MQKSNKQLEDFLASLTARGFLLQEDAIGFIYFGKHFTDATDEVIIAAIEYTLKAQKSFDGSFYISLLETFSTHKLHTKEDVYRYLRENNLLVV